VPSNPMTPERYEIVTLADFLKVPQDLIPACLADFDDYVSMCRELADIKGVEPIKFTWINDGISGISAVNLIIGSGSEREDS